MTLDQKKKCEWKNWWNFSKVFHSVNSFVSVLTSCFWSLCQILILGEAEYKVYGNSVSSFNFSVRLLKAVQNKSSFNKTIRDRKLDVYSVIVLETSNWVPLPTLLLSPYVTWRTSPIIHGTSPSLCRGVVIFYPCMGSSLVQVVPGVFSFHLGISIVLSVWDNIKQSRPFTCYLWGVGKGI
jgi:hypothetical protein